MSKRKSKTDSTSMAIYQFEVLVKNKHMLRVEDAISIGVFETVFANDECHPFGWEQMELLEGWQHFVYDQDGPGLGSDTLVGLVNHLLVVGPNGHQEVGLVREYLSGFRKVRDVSVSSTSWGVYPQPTIEPLSWARRMRVEQRFAVAPAFGDGKAHVEIRSAS